MVSKLNNKAVDVYATKLCNKILNSFFSTNEVINGSQILELTPLKQINLFVIKDLFITWENQLHSQRSPHFDYDNESVMKALKEYMNVLSRHISIRRKDFEPLLQKAVIDTMKLIFSPKSFFNSNIKEDSKKFFGNKKYYQVNRVAYEALESRLRSMGTSAINEAKLDEVIETVFTDFEDQLERPDDYVKLLSRLEPFNPTDFFTSADIVVEDRPGSDNAEPGRVQDEPEEGKLETLNDAHAEGRSTLAETMQRGKIENIENSLTVNQRFMFVKELFEGNVEEFKKAISYLDDCATREEALKYIEDNYGKLKNWDIEKEVVIEFYDLVSRKFIQESTQ